MNEIKVKETWRVMFHRLAIVVPLKILSWLDGEKTKAKKQHPLTILIVCLILLLSVASVTNLYTRANTHHAGISAYATGAGFAFLVPLSIFFAVYMPLGKVGKVGAWAISIVFAATSSAIQYKIYAPVDGSISLEAVAFGAGIPVAECLLAVLEGILINYLARKEQTIMQAEADKEQAESDSIKAADLAEQARIEAQRRADEQTRMEQERQQALFDFEMEAKRLELAAKLEAERLMLQAKLDAKAVRKVSETVRKVSEQSDGSGEKEPVYLPLKKRPTGEEKLFDVLNREQSGDLPKQKREDLYKQCGLTRTRMYELIKEWSQIQALIAVTLPPAPIVTANGHARP